jgi:two-component system sensor histidine kinase KdpD
MGAETATIPGNEVAEAVAQYARNHNLARIVIGRSHSRMPLLQRSLATRVGTLAPDLDVIHIAREEGVSRTDDGDSNIAKPT